MAGTASRASFGRQVAVLMSWTFGAQVVSLLAMLVLPRLILPAQFGVYSVFSGVVVMLAIVIAGRYEFAIGLPESDGDAAGLFTLCVGLIVVAAAVCAALLAALPEHNGLFSRWPELRPWWPWIAPGAACIGLYTACSYLAMRAANYRVLGRSKASIAGVTALGQVGAAALVSHSEGALIIPFVLGQVVGVLWIVHGLAGQRVWNVERATVVQVARRYARFPAFVAPGSLLDGIAALLPVAFISATHSPAEAGIYALADRTLRMPVTLIGSSVLQVFYERAASRRGDPVGMRSLLLKTWKHLALIAALPAAGVLVFGPELFGLVFGAAWRTSGGVAQLLSVSIFVYFVSYPTSNILVVNERVGSFLGWQAGQLVLVGSALALASHGDHRSVQATVAYLAASQVAVSLLSMVLQWRSAGHAGGAAQAS
jgi:O-antigen/teichoic acid export membrane protein